MIDDLFNILIVMDEVYWRYIGFSLVIAVGLYLSFKNKFYQLKILTCPIKTLRKVKETARMGEGISPFRVYFASVGGMIGLGNIVGIITAVIIGGPGALIWLWIAAICGMPIKYSEIFLGMKFRQGAPKEGYHGGPMIYLKHAFKSKWLSVGVPYIFCVLLAFYGVEIYQFSVVVDTLSITWGWDRNWLIMGFLVLVLYSGFGGIRRLANISTIVMPIFILGYMGLSFYVILHYIRDLPHVLWMALISAWNGHSAIGGFAGSTMLMAIQLGTARIVYSGDLGIGYDAIIQTQSQAKDPKAQASLSIFGVATDAIICTLSILVVLLSGVWNQSVPAFQAVAMAFKQVLPYADVFMALVIFMAGYTTIIAYLAVGEKAASWLCPKYGKKIYIFYALSAFIIFSFLDQTQVLLVMSLSGGMLMLTNLLGIWKLRHHIEF